MIQNNIDVLMLQETHFNTRSLVYAFRKWHKIPAWFSLGKQGSAGVAIVLNPNLNYNFIREEPDIEGRFLLIEVEIDGLRYVLCSVYAPSKVAQKKEFINKIPLLLGDSNGVLIIAGDFNTTVENNKESKERKSDAAKRTLQSLMDNLQMTETWKFAKDQRNRYSRMGPGGNETQIDYIFIEKALSDNCIELEREYIKEGQKQLSDHALITLSLNKEELKKSKSRSGYWKMNTGMLEDQQIKSELDDLIDRELERISDFREWIIFKGKIKSWAQKTSRILKRARREDITLIRNLIRAVSPEGEGEDITMKKDLEDRWKEEMTRRISQ